jgi:hypothetical protein
MALTGQGVDNPTGLIVSFICLREAKTRKDDVFVDF